MAENRHFTIVRELAAEGLKAVAYSIIIQLFVSAYRWGQTAQWQFSWEWTTITTIWLLLIELLWSLWLRLHPRSAAAIYNLNRWTLLRQIISKNRIVAAASLGILVTSLLATELENMIQSTDYFLKIVGRYINQHILTFHIFGTRINAIDILTLECLGFLCAVGAQMLYSTYAPSVFKISAGTTNQQSLYKTIREHVPGVTVAHVRNTLQYFRRNVAAKPIHKGFDWSAVDREFQIFDREVEAHQLSAMQTASHIIEIGPQDEEAYGQLGISLFDVSRPSVRHFLAALLAAALVLTSLPVALRILILFFPAMHGGRP